MSSRARPCLNGAWSTRSAIVRRKRARIEVIAPSTPDVPVRHSGTKPGRRRRIVRMISAIRSDRGRRAGRRCGHVSALLEVERIDEVLQRVGRAHAVVDLDQEPARLAASGVTVTDRTSMRGSQVDQRVPDAPLESADRRRVDRLEDERAQPGAEVGRITRSPGSVPRMIRIACRTSSSYAARRERPVTGDRRRERPADAEERLRDPRRIALASDHHGQEPDRDRVRPARLDDLVALADRREVVDQDRRAADARTMPPTCG